MLHFTRKPFEQTNMLRIHKATASLEPCPASLRQNNYTIHYYPPVGTGHKGGDIDEARNAETLRGVRWRATDATPDRAPLILRLARGVRKAGADKAR